MAKDKFYKSKTKTEGPKEEDKTLSQRGVNFQTEAAKSQMKISDIEVTKSQLLDEFAARWYKSEQIQDHYNIPDKRRVKILEKVLCGPGLPDALRPIKDHGEAAYYLALRDVQDVSLILVEHLFNEMRDSEEKRQEAKIKDEIQSNKT